MNKALEILTASHEFMEAMRELQEQIKSTQIITSNPEVRQLFKKMAEAIARLEDEYKADYQSLEGYMKKEGHILPKSFDHFVKWLDIKSGIDFFSIDWEDEATGLRLFKEYSEHVKRKGNLIKRTEPQKLNAVQNALYHIYEGKELPNSCNGRPWNTYNDLNKPGNPGERERRKTGDSKRSLTTRLKDLELIKPMLSDNALRKLSEDEAAILEDLKRYAK